MMTKKEKAEFDAAILHAETLAALRWTEPVKKDLPRPAWGDKDTSGWDYNSYAIKVDEQWSSAGAHGDGKARGHSASQNGVDLFSTKLLALRAMRNAMELDFASKLLSVDKLIEHEIGGDVPEGVTA